MADLFVVESIHEGTDLCVRRASAAETAEERANGKGWAMPYEAAVALAKSSARHDRCQWYDFSSDPAPNDYGTKGCAVTESKRCETCLGEGEVETCMVCANAVDTCECEVGEGEESPGTDMEECSECGGTGSTRLATPKAGA